MQAWVHLVVGIDLIAVAVGIWYAKEWARWAAGMIASFYVVWGLVSVIRELATTGDPLRLIGLIVVGLMGILAWYSFLPSTRRSFAAAREAIARTRAVPS